MTMTDESMVWHDDGHVIHLQLNRSEMRIVSIDCPNQDNPTRTCLHPDSPCVVQHFVQRFGLDCNVGVCAPSESLTVAWSFVGDSHKEIENGQVWIIPIDDEAFAAWLIRQKEQ